MTSATATSSNPTDEQRAAFKGRGATPPPASAPLEPDRDQIEIFVDAMFRHASPAGIVSLRAFHEEDNPKPFRVTAAPLSGGRKFLIDAAEDDARRAANFTKPIVFCPPLTTFSNKDRARERDIAEGLALSVECDQRPLEAVAKLEQILGRPTVVVASGGKWTDPASGKVHDKLHLHWRLRRPATGEDVARLKQARDLAARLVGGDPSNKPVCHPIRWPGSWHRKAEPVMCRIEESHPDNEIDLDAALAALIAASPKEEPKEKAKPNGEDHRSTDWGTEFRGIISGADYHGAVARLAMKMLTAGIPDGVAVNMLRGFMEIAEGPRDDRWQSRYNDIPRAVSTAREKLGSAQQEAPPEPPKPIIPTHSQWREPEEIPRRKQLYGALVRGFVNVTVGRTKGGKTMQAVAEMLSMVTCKPLLGTAAETPLRVWYIGEDPMDEIERRITAAAKHFGIIKTDVGNRLFVDSVLDGKLPKIRIAEIRNRAAIVNETEVVEQLIAGMKEKSIDVLILDPLIKFHAVPESDNSAMELVINALTRVTTATDSAIDVLHHIRKQGAGMTSAATIDDGRGASAVISTARSARVVNRMTSEEALKAGILDKERWRYFRVDSENNMAPPEADVWRHLVSVALPCGDSVGVCEKWQFPNPFENITVRDVETGAELARTGSYRADSRAKSWYGHALAKALDIPLADNPANLAKIKAIIKKWLDTGVLSTEGRHDDGRKEREFIIPGPKAPHRKAAGQDEQDNAA